MEVPLIREGGRWELDFAGLEAAFAAGARAYLLCNPHNPTGRVFTPADLGRIASLAEQYGVLVLADEIHASLTLPGARHTPFVSLGGAALAAWDSGADWLDALLGQLDHARTEFGRLLGERLPGAAYTPPEASYLSWVDCAGLGLGPEPAAVFLDRGRVALGRGLDFGAPGDGFVRVTIGTSSALLANIVDRMAAAVGA